MNRSSKTENLVVGILVGVAILSANCLGTSALAADPEQSRVIYDPDPDHLWNRLHRALLIRTAPDNKDYGQDRIEPLLWTFSKHLLEKESNERLIAVLEEFIRNQGEGLITSPLKRAVLQRDLWLVFDWLETGHHNFAEPRLDKQAWQDAQLRLRRPLALVIQRLALNPDAIEKLPDNYSAALMSGEFPSKYEPTKPDLPYLPDLYSVNGSWVCVGPAHGAVAPEHQRENNGNPFANSAFLVFLRLPGGRTASLAYLKALSAFDQPLLTKPDNTTNSSNNFLPNSRLPQFPVGTEVALVRRALLVNLANAVAATALTESVQLRVYREVPEMTIETLNTAQGGSTRANQRIREWQAFHEFRLSRQQLFRGKSGGLRPVESDERDFKTGFGAHPWDEFETQSTGQSFAQRTTQHPIKNLCAACHSFPGVTSFNSFSNDWRSGLQRGTIRKPNPLGEINVSDALRSAVELKSSRSNWQALQTILQEK